MSVFTRDPTRVKLEKKIVQAEREKESYKELVYRENRKPSHKEAKELTLLREKFWNLWNSWLELQFTPLTFVHVGPDYDFDLDRESDIEGVAVVLADNRTKLEVFSLRSKKIVSIRREWISYDFEFSKEDEREFLDYLSNKTRVRVEEALEEVGHPLAGQIFMRSVL